MGTLDIPPSVPPGKRISPSLILTSVIILLLLLALGLPPLLSWGRAGRARALSLNNARRLAYAALLYAQDWDGRFMPPKQSLPDGSLRMWPEIVRPYVAPTSVFDDPANPLDSVPGPLRHPTEGYPVHSAYALNHRFWNTFGSGPFPVENLEIPAQTALFVEAGPMWKDPLHPPHTNADRAATAVQDYGDTLDRFGGFCPYPSPHDGKIVVVAADGHGVFVKVAHYRPADGLHDPLYGHLGGNLFNWNGGHPNGELDHAFLE